MKLKVLWAVLTCLFLVAGTSLNAQFDELMEGVAEAAETYNQQNGQNNAGQNQGANGLSPWQEELQAQWEAEWQAQQNAELFNALDSKYLQCTALMVLYLDMYLKLTDEHRIGDIAIPECDAYGMQALALASSTTIMYCPEGMSELSDEELKEIGHEFIMAVDPYVVPGYSDANGWNPAEMHPLADKLSTISKRFWLDYADLYPEWTQEEVIAAIADYFIKYMIEFFKPAYILSQTLYIGQKMEELGCSG